MKILCRYYESSVGYVCEIENQQIPSKTNLEIVGIHKNGRTVDDVNFVDFIKCGITKFPQGLTKIFANLEGIQIRNSNLKDLRRADLIEYKNLKSLYLGSNQIEYLPGDLFVDCKQLNNISFISNPLTTVEPNILDGLEHLKYVCLDGKISGFGSIFSYLEISSTDRRLVELKNNLLERFIKNDQKNLNVDESGHKSQKRRNKFKRLEAKVEELTKLNQSLTQQNQKLQDSKLESYSSKSESETTFTYTSDLKTFLQTDESFKDLQIVIKSRRFLIHKIVLVAQSSTVAEMLRNNPEAKDLNLDEIPEDIFENIVKFLYTDELPVDGNFIELYTAAERLKIKGLMDYASEKILEQLNIENALEVLNLGNKCGHDEMTKKAFEAIKQKYPNVVFKDK